MKKTVYYWSPLISKIATLDAVINSAYSLMLYSKKYDSYVLNLIGEFNILNNNYFKKKINLINFKNIFLHKMLSDKGYLLSRISFIFIFFTSFVKLKSVLEKNKPDFLIIHLITSLPLLLNFIYNFNTKIILRISGFPKLNFVRKYFWKVVLKKVYKVTCPTMQTKELLIRNRIVDPNKIVVLRDPAIHIKRVCSQYNEDINENYGKYIFAAGRLTKQKNFKFLLESFFEVSKKYPLINLVIAGEGEDLNFLKNIVKKLNIMSRVYFIGYQNNIFKYFKNCEIFVSTSLWEDPGFVIIEAAFCKVNIISSNCPNGPIDFFDNKRLGYVFDINNKLEFLDLIDTVLSDKNSTNQINKKILLKRSNEYTLFNHFKELNNLLSQ